MALVPPLRDARKCTLVMEELVDHGGVLGGRAGRAVMNVSDSFPRPSEVCLSVALSEPWLLCKVLCISVLNTQASFAVQLNSQNLGLFPQLPTWCPVYLQTHQRSSRHAEEVPREAAGCSSGTWGGVPLESVACRLYLKECHVYQFCPPK